MATHATRERTEVGRRYTSVAIALHWTIAAMILYNLLSGLARPLLPRGFFLLHVSSGITILVLSAARVVWRLTHRPPDLLPMPAREKVLAHSVHFLLYAAMLALPLTGWAMLSANPPIGSPGAALADQQRAERKANVPQRLPGGDRIKTPGGASGEGGGGGQAPHRRGPTMIWGLARLPMIAPIAEVGRVPEGLPRQHQLHERLETAHLLGGWIMLLLLVLHVGGALKHQWIDRERELERMGLGFSG